jgi:hypothetical protein
MAVKPSLVSKEAKQRSGDLPTLIPFRRSAWKRPSVQEHLAAQLVYRLWSASQRPKTLTARCVIAIVRSKRATASAAQQPDDRAAALCGPVGRASRRSMLPSSLCVTLSWLKMRGICHNRSPLFAGRIATVAKRIFVMVFSSIGLQA